MTAERRSEEGRWKNARNSHRNHHRSVTLEKVTDEKVNDPRLVRLRRKIETRLDPRIGFGARRRILMKDGSEHKAFLSKPKGDPENPLSFDELTTQYRQAA